MIGDRPIALLALFSAALLHVMVLILLSYMPLPTLEPSRPPSRTRYIVQFQQPAPTTAPTSVPIAPAPTPPLTPVQPEPIQPLPRQPAPMPQPVRITPQPTQTTAIEVQRPEPQLPPVEQPVQPRQPTSPPEPVRAPPRPTPPKPIAPNQTTTPRTPAEPRLSSPKQPSEAAKRAVPPPTPTTQQGQELQRQYLTMVAEAIQRHKHYPKTAQRRGLSGQVVLHFVILPSGQVTEARIVASQSTRHSILNNAALRALKRASPLPPFPKALKKRALRVTLPISYELTER